MQDQLKQRIIEIVKKIPAGKVATYGQIAEMVGIRDARMVARAISGNEDPEIPCHRLVKADGLLALNYSKGDWREDREKLLLEGVGFLAERRVDLERSRCEY